MKESPKFSISSMTNNLEANKLVELNDAREYFKEKIAEIKMKYNEVPLLTALKNWKQIPTVSVK